jgi:hypothetical protein
VLVGVSPEVPDAVTWPGLRACGNWSLMAPREFSSDEGKQLHFRCTVEKEKLLY